MKPSLSLCYVEGQRGADIDVPGQGGKENSGDCRIFVVLRAAGTAGGIRPCVNHLRDPPSHCNHTCSLFVISREERRFSIVDCRV
jgi:hypothetical protein